MLPAGLDILGRPKGENRIAHGLFSVRPSGAWNSHKKMYKLQSRHFVPGYYQPVPPGQKPFAHRSIEAPHNYLSAYGLNGTKLRRMWAIYFVLASPQNPAQFSCSLP